MTDSSPPAAPGGLRRRTVVIAGIGILVASWATVVLAPPALPAVCVWWLADDLMRNPRRRPATLGWIALGGFSLAAIGGVGAFLLVDAHFDCGGTLGGFGEAADARLDEDCAAGQQWRAVVGVLITMAICAAGVMAVKRSDPRVAPIAVAARTVAAMTTAIVVVTLTLAFT